MDECKPLALGGGARADSGGGGGGGGGCERDGQVTIIELIDPRPYIFQTPVHGSLIYTVIYMSDRLLTQANPNPRLFPRPDLRDAGGRTPLHHALRYGHVVRRCRLTLSNPR